MEIPQATQSHDRLTNRVELLKASIVSIADCSSAAILAIRRSDNEVEKRIAAFQNTIPHAEKHISDLNDLSAKVKEKQLRLSQLGQDIDNPELSKFKPYFRRLIGILITEIESVLGPYNTKPVSLPPENFNIEKRIKIFSNTFLIPGENIRFEPREGVIVKALKRAGLNGLSMPEILEAIAKGGYGKTVNTHGVYDVNERLKKHGSLTRVVTIRKVKADKTIEKRYVLAINTKAD